MNEVEENKHLHPAWWRKLLVNHQEHSKGTPRREKGKMPLKRYQDVLKEVLGDALKEGKKDFR